MKKQWKNKAILKVVTEPGEGRGCGMPSAGIEPGTTRSRDCVAHQLG